MAHGICNSRRASISKGTRGKGGLKPGLYKFTRYVLGPGEAVFGERQGANALAGSGKNGVADSG